MSIPKIIHQTGKSRHFFGIFKAFHHKLLQLHPHWELRFYDDMDCRNVISEHFSSFLSMYDSFTHPIQKADFFRWAVVYRFGGFYLDLDMQCLKAIDDLCQYDVVFSEEKTLTEQEKKQLNHREERQVGNYMFGSVTEHPFVMEMMIQIKQVSTRPIQSEQDIIKTTGPGLITRVYFDRQVRYKDVALLRNSSHMCPYCLRVSCHFGDYARHCHVGSWRWERQQHSADRSPETPNALKKKKIEKIYAELKRIALLKHENTNNYPPNLEK